MGSHQNRDFKSHYYYRSEIVKSAGTKHQDWLMLKNLKNFEYISYSCEEWWN